MTILYVGGKQFDDHGAMSVQKWPHKLQEFDCDANSIKSLQVGVIENKSKQNTIYCILNWNVFRDTTQFNTSYLF